MELINKKKKAISYRKQPFMLPNFNPFGPITPWTRRNCVRIIIKSDYFTAFYAFVATFTRFFSSCIHNMKLNRLITRFRSKTTIETFLTTLFGRTDFNFFCYSCRRSSRSLSFGNKSASASISNPCRYFTHFLKF